MNKAQRFRGAGTARLDMAATRLRRAEAITELVYGEAAAQHTPETYRYQRLARSRIAGCPHWG
eukprot:8977515-Lingulodinium_polyedra.AAC.1